MTYKERIQIIDEQIGYFESLRDSSDDHFKKVIQRLQIERSALEEMVQLDQATIVADRTNRSFEFMFNSLEGAK